MDESVQITYMSKLRTLTLVGTSSGELFPVNLVEKSMKIESILAYCSSKVPTLNNVSLQIWSFIVQLKGVGFNGKDIWETDCWSEFVMLLVLNEWINFVFVRNNRIKYC